MSHAPVWSQLPVPLGSTATIDHPTPDTLAEHISLSLKPAAAVPPSLGALVAVHNGTEQSLGVGGISLLLPGCARDAQQLWRVLCTIPDTREEVPASRFDMASFFSDEVGAEGKSYNRLAHLVGEVEMFDAAAFGVSPAEVAQMDPQQRLLLEASREAACAAGLDAEALHGSATGVFVGLGNNDWAHLQGRSGAPTPHTITGHSVSLASGRIAFALGCVGPAVTSDTACSSATVALDQGLQAIRLGRSKQALCGGVNLLLMGERFVELCQAHMLSETQRCRPFDAEADGYVRGEGCVMVMVQRHATGQGGTPTENAISGVAINQDGHSLSLVAPSGPQQQRCIRTALLSAGADAAQVGFLEANSTGGKLGDAVEVGALRAVFGAAHPVGGAPLRIGAVKGLLGNLESVVGMASLLKAMLVLRARQVTPNPFPVVLSPQVAANAHNFEMEVVRSGRAQLSAAPQLAALSNFGFAGTNVHLLLREEPPAAAGSAATACRLLLDDSGEERLRLGSLAPPGLAWERRAYPLRHDGSEPSVAAQLMQAWERARPPAPADMNEVQVIEAVRLCVLGSMSPDTALEGEQQLEAPLNEVGVNETALLKIVSNVNARFGTSFTRTQAAGGGSPSVRSISAEVMAYLACVRKQRGVLGEAQVREVVRGFVLDNLPAGTALSAADCAEQTLMQLGASSMSIMQALALVNARFSTEITMRMVIGNGPSSVDAIARAVMEHQARAVAALAGPRDIPPARPSDASGGSSGGGGTGGGGAGGRGSVPTPATSEAGSGPSGDAARMASYMSAPTAAKDDGGGGEAAVVQLPSAQQFALVKTIVRNLAMAKEQTYGYCVGVTLTGDVQPAFLRRAIGLLVSRHETLRTHFDEDTYYQVVAQELPMSAWLTERDVSEQEDPDASAREHMLAEANRPMDIFTGPLFRVLMLHTKRATTKLILNFHHLIDDGGSVGIFYDELWALYHAMASGRTIDGVLGAKLPYTAYIDRQRRDLCSGGVAAQYEQWNDRFGRLPVPLPVLRMQWEKPQGSMDENRMIGMAGFDVPRELVSRLNRAAAEASVTTNTALLAAFLVLCGRYAWMEPPRVACVIAFNERQDDEMRTIGFLTNLLIVDTTIGARQSFAAIMQAVHRSVLFAIDNSTAFFPTVWKEWRKSSRRARLVYFNIESNWRTGDVGGLQVEPIEAPSRRNIFDMELKFELKQSSEGYLGCVEYDKLVYDPTMMAALGEHFVSLLGALTAACDRPAWQQPFLIAPERALVLGFAQAGGSGAKLAAARPVHTLWDPGINCHAAAATAIALVSGEGVSGDRLTYGEMHDRARAIAAALLARSEAATGGRVALCVEPASSVAGVVALLGALMSGGVPHLVSPDASYAAAPPPAAVVGVHTGGRGECRYLTGAKMGGRVLWLDATGALRDPMAARDVEARCLAAAAAHAAAGGATGRVVALLEEGGDAHAGAGGGADRDREGSDGSGGGGGGNGSGRDGASLRLHALSHSVACLHAVAALREGEHLLLACSPRGAQWLQSALGTLLAGALSLQLPVALTPDLR